MTKSSIRKANAEAWRRRLAAADTFPGTITEYCRREGISREALRYWRGRLAKTRTPAEATAGFARVEVLPAAPVAPIGLPDPRWVAELILHLQAGGRR